MEVLKHRPEIMTVLEKVTFQQEFKEYQIVDVQKVDRRDGYLGEIFLISLKDQSTDRTLNLAIKLAFTINKVTTIRACFENEIFYYSTIYPALKQFWKSRLVKSEFNFAPECLYSALDQQPEVLVLENLRSVGFEIFDKKQALDHDHVMLIFKNYGRYHALSMALRDQNPELFKKLTDNMNKDLYMSFIEKDHMVKYFLETALQAQKALKPGTDDDLLKDFEKYTTVRNLSNLWKNSIDSDCDYTAILHGDCWSNNMMFRHENSKPVEMRLIDFQLLKVGSPVCDLSYFFYSGISTEGLQNFKEYIDEYYTSFSATARELGSNPEKIFPLEELKKAWNRHAKFGLIMTFNILKLKMIEGAEIMDLSDVVTAEDEKIFSQNFKSIKFRETEYNEKMRAILRHMYDLEAL